jgi:heme-degrading monooxygenase HmoA
MHILKTTPEQHDRGLEIVRDQLLPYLRDSTGFRGMIRLADREGGQTLVITLWADAEALNASAEAAKSFSDLATAVSGADRDSIKNYEAELFDVT